MKACADCGPCLMKRILFQSRLAGTGKEFESVKKCMGLYSGLMAEDVCSAEIATAVHALSYRIMECEDPYSKLKTEGDEVAERFLPAAEDFICSSGNRLRAAVRVSIIGNIMDFGSGVAIDSPSEFEKMFGELLAQGIESDDSAELARLISASDTVLYAFDNCGESQFDKPLIREIKKLGKRVVGVVRGKAILNDVTYEDAVRIGLDRELDRIVSTGAFAIGFPRVTEDPGLAEELSRAGVMIAKGMANYESLSEIALPIPVAFLLRAKCLPVAESLGVSQGTNVVRIKPPADCREKDYDTMLEIKQAVIMVGGKGTRLYPLTENVPKPALPVLDMPCLKYLIKSFASAGIREIFLACGYKSDILRKEIGYGTDLGVEIIYSDEETPLGTGGAMKQLESRLDSVFAAANGDTFIDIDLREQIREHFASGAKITIALTRVDNPCEYGIARICDDGRITEFKDKPKPEEVFSDRINAGIYVVDKSVLAHVPDNSFFDFSKDLVPLIADMGWRVQGYTLRGGAWKDVGRPSDLIGVNLLMAERRFSGVRFHTGEGTVIRGPFYLGRNSAIRETEADSVVILDDCVVEGCGIAQSLIMDGCNANGARITDSILGRNCRIGYGAIISHCVLKDGTVVENGTVLENKVG